MITLSAIANFDYSFDSKKMNSTEKKILRWLGQMGIVYCMFANLLYLAAVTYDPQAAGGLAESLTALRDQSFVSGFWG